MFPISEQRAANPFMTLTLINKTRVVGFPRPGREIEPQPRSA
jgi:hypothetical protein